MPENKFLGNEIKKLSCQFRRQMDKNFNINLNGNQRFILNFIMDSFKQKKDIFQKDIEKYFDIRRSTATVILQILEKNEFIKRVPVDYDARLKKIVPIYKFDKNEFEKKVQIIEKKAIIGITQEELNIFMKVLEKIKINLEESKDE